MASPHSIQYLYRGFSRSYIYRILAPNPLFCYLYTRTKNLIICRGTPNPPCMALHTKCYNIYVILNYRRLQPHTKSYPGWFVLPRIRYTRYAGGGDSKIAVRTSDPSQSRFYIVANAGLVIGDGYIASIVVKTACCAVKNVHICETAQIAVVSISVATTNTRKQQSSVLGCC